MRRSSFLLSALALGLCACGDKDIKTGSLVQRYTMVNVEGRQFGIVELDPINGGSIVDMQGRTVGRIVSPATTTVASAPMAPVVQ